MSVDVMNLAIKHGPRDSAAFLVLLSLADHGDKFGGNCWPSQKLIAHEMRISESTVIRGKRVLFRDGWITAARTSTKDHKGNSYQLNLAKLKSNVTMTVDSEQKSKVKSGKVKGQRRQSQRSNVPESKVKGGSPLIGTVINRQEPSENRPPKPPTGGPGDHALSRDPLIADVGYVETDQGYLTHEDVEALKGSFADGNRFADPFAFEGTLFVDAFTFAEGYVPELDFDPHEYAKLTRDEFVDWIILAGYQCDSYVLEEPRHETTAGPTRTAEAQETHDNTERDDKRRRRLNVGKPDRLRSNTHSR
jgi:hypothetical protein